MAYGSSPAAVQQTAAQQPVRAPLPVPASARIVLYPFTLQVAQDVANALLYHYVRYHAHLGFTTIQYSQVNG